MGKKDKKKGHEKEAPKRERVKVDREAMKKDKKRADKRSGGADIHTIPEGNTSYYICGPVHPGYPKSVVECAAHFRFAGSAKTITNLEGLEDHEEMMDALAHKELSWKDAQKGWEFANDKTAGGGGRDELKPRWYFAVVPWASRDSEDDPWKEFEDKTVEILACGKNVYDGIYRAMFEEADDITDPDEAILVYINRVGKDRQTKYTLSSARRGIKIPKKVWAKIEADLQPGKAGDIFRLLASMTRPLKGVKAIWNGDNEGDKGKDDETKVKTRKSRRDEPEEPKKGKGKSVREKRAERKAARSGNVGKDMAAESRKRAKAKGKKKKK